MTTRYSPSTGNFFPTEIDYQSLPDDLIEVSKSDYDAAMNRPAGFAFYFDEGKLVIVPPVQETPAELMARALNDIRKQRAPILATLDGIAGRSFRAGDMVTAQAADTAINALLDITKLPQLLAATTYDEIKAVVLARYRQIAGAAPALVQSAFLEVAAA